MARFAIPPGIRSQNQHRIQKLWNRNQPNSEAVLHTRHRHRHRHRHPHHPHDAAIQLHLGIAPELLLVAGAAI